MNEIDKNTILDGITLSGGEPFLQASPLVVLSKEVRRRSLSVVVYTGFTFDEILCSGNEDQLALLHEADILIDGPYIESERSLALKFRGSANQRIIDVQRSLNSKKIIEHFLQLFRIISKTALAFPVFHVKTNATQPQGNARALHPNRSYCSVGKIIAPVGHLSLSSDKFKQRR